MNTPDPALLARSLALFDELIELSMAERSARIAVLATSEPLLADAVAKLLAADADHSGMLDHGVAGIAHTLLTELGDYTPPDGRIQSGMQIAAFTLQRQLGVGGMGEVWLAQRREGNFVQDVALKLLKRGMDSDELSRRFVRERRILAELNHPHIAGFIDGGVSSDGRLYYAMEYVDGVAITTFAGERALSVRARMQLLVAVCEAVAYAQSHLVVHRDLKPSNILIDASGQPRVLDFGIAKLIGESVADTALTASGMRMLSPAYAAPEQVLDEPISTATDVYSLGVLAFELLTNQLPHSRSGNLVALAEQVREEHTQAPSAALRHSATQPAAATASVSQQRAAREVAGDLDVIVLTALKREPARRYANAAALADDLKRWLDGRPIAAQADTAGYRARKFVARNRLAVGSASAVLLALIAGFGVALWQANVAREQAALARAEAARAEQQAAVATEATERAKRVKDFMMQTFVAADPLQKKEGAPTTVAEAFEQAVARVDTELAGDPRLQVDVLDDFSEIRAGQGRFEEARILVNRALSQAEKIYPPDHPAIAESLVNRAAMENYSGNDYAKALQDLERAVAILEHHRDSEPLALANALNSLAVTHKQTGRPDEALKAFQRSLKLWRQFKVPSTDGMAAVLNNIASALIDRGQYDEAEPYIEEAIAEVTRLSGTDNLRLVPMLGFLSDIQYRRGQHAEVTATNQRRLTLVTDIFPGAHPWTASVMTEIGQQLMESEPVKATQQLDAAIAMQIELDSGQVLIPLRYRALLARDEEGNAGAIRYFDQALAVCAQRKLDHLMCDLIRANRAGVVADAGDGQIAMTEVETAMAGMRAKGAAHDNEYAQALESKAIAHKALGQREEAIATQTDALNRYIALFGESHEEVTRAKRNLQKLQ